MADQKRQQSFEEVWQLVKNDTFPHSIKLSVHWRIAQIRIHMRPCKNPHKIDRYERMIKYIKMMEVLDVQP